jgi:hypothetical protein
MARERKTLTPAEAGEFTRALERRAETIGTPLDQWLLIPRKKNDIRQGTGPRFAIVQRALECAAAGGKYGHVLGSIVIQGNGERYTIKTHDLAGFVCANKYCEAVPPGKAATSQSVAATHADPPIELPKAEVCADPLPANESTPKSEPIVRHVDQPASPCEPLRAILAGAYPCPCFKSVCSSMRWAPEAGHIPRGYLGATGRPEEVELVLVVAEPGDPQPGDHSTMEDALRHAYWAFREGPGQFHQNARFLFNLCWPSLNYDEQLRKVWVTESVLCSAKVSAGSVPGAVELACGERYLKKQIQLFPQALVVALGDKATNRMSRIGVRGFERAFALGKPGCFQRGAQPSWHRIAELLAARK